MTEPILPPKLREEILNMFAEGASSIEVFDAVCEKAIEYAKSENQLSRCITGLKSLSAKRQVLKLNGSNQEVQGSAAIPFPNLYNDELKPLFDGNPAPLEPIEDWLKERIWQKLKSQ